jgi:hypothetical protein
MKGFPNEEQTVLACLCQCFEHSPGVLPTVLLLHELKTHLCNLFPLFVKVRRQTALRILAKHLQVLENSACHLGPIADTFVWEVNLHSENHGIASGRENVTPYDTVHDLIGT